MKTALRRSVGLARALALASMLAASFAVPAQATTAPSLDQQQPAFQAPMGHVSGQVAQTFTAGMKGVLDHVSLVTATTNGSRIVVEVFNTDVNGAPTGSPLGATLPMYLTCCPQWHDFTFTSPVQVTPGARYAIVVPIDGSYVTWWYATSNPYSRGQMWLTFSPSGPWLTGMQGRTNYANFDFAFKTWVTVGSANTAPTLTEASQVDSITEGTTPAMSGSFADNDGDTVALSADQGTLTAPTGVSSGGWSWTMPATDEPLAQPVTVTATDSQGLSSSVKFMVDVAGVGPTVTITSDPLTSPEGSTVPLTASATSPDAADNAAGFTYAWTVTKDGSPFASGSGPAWSFTTPDEGTYQVTVSATDDGGMAGYAPSLTVIGTDVTPTSRITGISASPSLVVAPQELLSFSGSFSDPGPDSHVATWDFGDGTSLTTPTIPAGGSTNLAASHSFAAAGTYTVRLKVADDDGTTGVAATTVTVQTPQQALGSIAAYVQALPGLNKGQVNSLLAKLHAASDAAARGDTNAANNQLNAFLNELAADVSSGKVLPANASVLSASVHAVQGALGTRNRFTDWWPLGL